MPRCRLVVLLLILLSVPGAGQAREPGEVVKVAIAKDVHMTFCWIPSGESQLGSTLAERTECLKLVKADAERQRLTTETEEMRGKFQTKGFWLGKFPVTQAEWTALMGKNASRFVPAEAVIKKAGIMDTGRFPVDGVSWDDCQEFLKKLNALPSAAPASMGQGKFVLPHEDQWEYACRGGKGNRLAYYFGNEHNGKQANSNGLHPFGTETPGPFLNRTAEVGTYEQLAPHPWGLCDMHGNIWQWCENKYSSDNAARVVRAGSWSSGCRGARSACRTGRAPTERSMYYGVRIAFVP